MAKVKSKRAGWFRRYFLATFVERDALTGAVVCWLTFLFAAFSEPARSTSGAVLPVTAGICAGILGIVLAAMAVVTAFITRGFVAVVQDIEEAMEPFATVARVAAGGILVTLGALLASGSADRWLASALLGLSAGATAWATLGVVDLVKITIYFAWVRSSEAHTLNEAEQISAARLRKIGDSNG